MLENFEFSSISIPLPPSTIPQPPTPTITTHLYKRNFKLPYFWDQVNKLWKNEGLKNALTTNSTTSCIMIINFIILLLLLLLLYQRDRHSHHHHHYHRLRRCRRRRPHWNSINLWPLCTGFYSHWTESRDMINGIQQCVCYSYKVPATNYVF